MDHICAIQELIDENKDAMPTGVVVDVMQECQKALATFQKLWKVTYIHVVIDEYDDLNVRKKTMIAEEVAVDAPKCWFQVFATGTIPPAEMHDSIGGDYFKEGKTSVSVVVKVEPYLKRVRQES